jgi:hypothetical protein
MNERKPINETTLQEIENNFEYPSERQILRRDGRFYIDFSHNKKTGEFTIASGEAERIRENEIRLGIKLSDSQLTGRLWELVAVRMVWDVLAPYRHRRLRGFENQPFRVVGVCFHKEEHACFDILIPLTGDWIDAKTKRSDLVSYQRQKDLLLSDSFVYTGNLTKRDLQNVSEQQKVCPDFRASYLFATIAVEDTASGKPLRSDQPIPLRPTLMTLWSIIKTKKVKMKGTYGPAPKKGTGFFDWLESLRMEAESRVLVTESECLVPENSLDRTYRHTLYTLGSGTACSFQDFC